MMVTFLVSLVAVAGFAVALTYSGLAGVARKIVGTAGESVSTMLDPDLDDLAKEKAARGAAMALFGGSLALAWRIALCLAAAFLPIWLADLVGLAPMEDVFALMLRVDYIIGVTIAAFVVAFLLGRRKGEAGASDNPNTASDRMIHAVAFASPAVMKAAARLERRGLQKDGAETPPDPIFVTSLARAGTTAVLNALSERPEIATHTYRDMPFLTAPTVWNRLAGGAKRGVERHQRAHGDGLEIDLDSPEAFEEVLWKMFWPEKYRKGIALWSGEDRKPEADAFLAEHMAAIVRARRVQGRADARRYCSKNNANVARLDYIRDTFEDARIVIPVRRPEAHAASLLRQHRNFVRQQTDDAFVRRYMRDIGHFEFGLNLKPILFPGFDAKRFDPDTPDFWLDYWLHAFRHVRDSAGDAVFVLQDDLRGTPVETMSALCRTLGIDAADADFSTYFRPGADETDTSVFSEDLRAACAEVYSALEQTALRT